MRRMRVMGSSWEVLAQGCNEESLPLGPLPLTVNFAAMADTHDDHDHPLTINAIDDPIIANPNSNHSSDRNPIAVLTMPLPHKPLPVGLLPS